MSIVLGAGWVTQHPPCRANPDGSGPKWSHAPCCAEINMLDKEGLILEPEKAMAPHSSTLAWRTPWMEEPGGLQSMGLLGWT